MLKKSFVVLLAMVLVFALLGGCAQKSDVYEFRLAHFFPGTHPAETVLLTQWISEIEEATDGKVKITSYPGETLLGAPAIYGGVVDGVADMGLSCFAYTRGRFPVLEVFELPGVVYNNSSVASKVAWEGIQAMNPAGVQDTKLLMVFATGPGDLFTKTPVRILEDLRNMEIRATGISVKVLELLNANPNAMSQGEAYEALSRGAISGNLSPIEVLKGWRQAEVTSYITLTPFLYNTLFFINVNNQKWDALPEELQKIVLDVTARVYEETAVGLWDVQNADALTWIEETQNMEIIELSAAEQARWKEKVSVMLENYKVEITTKGHDGAQIVQTVLDLADTYNGIYR
ncbi:MAG: TRAP transporter substrate-binding protein [Clostridia bacterium]